MIYYFDVDGTICRTKGAEYAGATPIQKRIDQINKLYDEGNRIIIWTARGAMSGQDLLNLTKEQLDSWGVEYHELHKKPYFDLLVDDKALDAKTYFNGK
jgi:CMP-N,N'-diacetyllegionaminic acid synthase